MFKRSALAVVGILMLAAGGLSQAQPPFAVFCDALSEADCRLLERSALAMEKLSSAAFSIQMELVVEDIPDFNHPVIISLDGTGAFAAERRELRQLRDFSDGTTLEVFEGLAEAMELFDGQLDINFTFFSPELSTTASTSGTLPLELRLVDGFGYVNFDPIAPLLEPGNFEGWGGIDLIELIRLLIEQQPELFEDVSTRADDTPHQQLDAADRINAYTSIQRTDDGREAVAVFESTFDVAGFLSDEMVQDVICAELAQTQTEEGVSSEAQCRFGFATIEVLFDDTAFVSRQEIDLEESFVRRVEAEFNMTIDDLWLELLLQLPEVENPVTVDFTFSIDYFDFNEVAPIEAPADAAILPYEQVPGLLTGDPSV